MPGALPHYDVHDGSGPYALLVHGMLSSRAQWLGNLAALAKVCRPVVLELFGHGRSPAPGERAGYHPDRYVEAFDEIRGALGAERWLVVGQSLGAALTLRYALARPERTLAHVMTNSNSAFAPRGWSERVRAVMEGVRAAVEREGRGALERMPIHPRRARSLPAEVKRALVEDAALGDPLGIALTGLVTSADAPLYERVRENRVPTLLVVGTRERRFAEQAERARKEMPALEIVEIDAGHSVNAQRPAAFDAAVASFLARHARAG